MNTLGEVTTLRNASKILGVSQPVVSTRLREIEDAVDIKLFDRHPHGISPNKFGEALIVWSGIILTNVERARNDLEAMASRKSGRIRLGLTSVAEQSLVSKSLIKFHTLFPSILTFVQTGHDTNLLPSLLEGDLDLVICRLVPSAIRNALHHEVLYLDSTDVVVGADHPLAKKKPFVASELDKYEWILPPVRSSSFELVAKTLIMNGAAVPRIAIEITTTTFIPNILSGSSFISILPSKIAASHISKGTLARLPIQIGSVEQPIVILTRVDSGKNLKEQIELVKIFKNIAND